MSEGVFMQGPVPLLSAVVVERIGWLLLHSVWQFAAVALLAFWLDRILQRASAATRYTTLLTTMLLLLITPVATWGLLSAEVSRFTAISSPGSLASREPVSDSLEPTADGGEYAPLNAEPRVMPGASTEVITPPERDNVAASQTGTLLARPWGALVVDAVQPWLSAIVSVWCLGVLLFSIRPVWSWCVVRRMRTVGVAPVAEAVEQAFARACMRLRVSQRVRLLQSTLVNAPVVVGCLPVVILVPASFVGGVPVSQLEAILAHELAHVRRYDYLVNFLQTLVETLFFYHPAVWWLSHRLRIERENCCDDLAVAALGNKVEYGRALLAVEEFRSTTVSSLALSAKGGSLLARVKRLFADPPSDDQRGSAAWAAMGILFTGLAAALWALTTANAVERSSVDDDSQTQAVAAHLDDELSPQKPDPKGARIDESRSSKLREQALDGEPFRLPDHWIVEDVCWLNDDQELLTASIQGGVNVRRWDVAGRRLMSEIKLGSDQHGRPVRQGTIRLSPDGSRAIAVTDAYVGVWDTSTGELLRQVPIPQKQWEYDTVRVLACSADGSVIVAGLGTRYSRSTIRYPSYGIAWDARSGAVLSTFEQQGGYDVCDVAMTADGRRFATCNEGHRVCLWETSSGKLLGDYSELVQNWESPEPDLIRNQLVRGIELSADGRRLAIVGTFGIRLVDIDSGMLLRTIDAPVRMGLGDVVFSPDGRYLARFGSRRGREGPDSVVIWSLVTGEKESEFVTPGTIACFSSSSRQLAVGESDFYEAVSVWPMLGEQKKLGPLPPPAKTSRIDRVEENTHGRGKVAAEFARRWNVSWGPAQQGLQYGIALTSAGNRFRIGQRVPLVVFLKNTSDQPLQFDFRPDMFGNLPRVTSADGTPVELAKRNLLGPVAHYRDKLEPGELFGPLYLNFGLGPNPQPGTQEWTPHWSAPTAGVYKLMHQAPVHVADPKATGKTTGPDWRSAPLQSGSLEFELVDILVRESSRKFATGDDVTITSFSRLPAGSDHVLEVRGTYRLSSRDSADLSQWCAGGEVRGEKSMTITKGEGEFHFQFTLVKPGQLHLSLYPIAGGNSFGSLYYEPVDEKLRAELIGANSAAPDTAPLISWKVRETPFYRLHYDPSQIKDFEQLCVNAYACLENLRKEFGEERVDSLLKSAEIDIYLQPRPTVGAAAGLATLHSGTTDGVYRAELHLLAQSAHPEGATTNVGEPMDGNYLFKTLVHEYSTIVLERLTAEKPTGWRFFNAPSWFVQGYEEYLGLMLSSEHNRTVVFEKYVELHRADPLRVANDFTSIRSDYIDGAVLIRFLHETYGKEPVQSLLTSESAEFWGAVKSELGVGRAELFAAWQRYRSVKLIAHQENHDGQLPWRASGRVVDGNGKPLAGVTVRAATGLGTLRGGGSGVTDQEGHYDFQFGMGIMFGRGDDGTPSPQTQYALISARLDGYFEQNLSRHGNGIASLAPVTPEVLKHWGVTADQVCLPEKPRELNFVMLPAAKVAGTLIGEDGQPLKEYSVSLTGEELSPGSSVLSQVRTDEKGHFAITEIPTTIPYQFEVRKPRAQLKPPWDDSWASPPLTFANPGENDLRIRLKSPQAAAERLTVKSLQLKIVGLGVHGKTATQRAARRPLALPSDGGTRSPAELSFDKWTLTLSNGDQ